MNRGDSTGWSWKFCPTPGRSTTVSIPAASRSFLGPMPLSCNSCGVWMAPAARMTSLFARTVMRSVALRAVDLKTTPVARSSSKVIRVTLEFVTTS